MSGGSGTMEMHLYTAGGIGYRLVDQGGSKTEEAEEAFEVYIIRAADLRAFYLESFPPPVIVQGVPLINNRRMPGRFSLRTKSISWEKLVADKPVDVFGAYDLVSVYSDSFEDYVKVTINYTNEMEEQNAEDPKTFLQIRGNSAGEYLYVSTPQGQWGTSGTSDPVKHPTGVPTMVIVSETEWTLTWPRIPRTFYQETLIGRFRSAMGKVNEAAYAPLFDAPAETLLFVGHEYDDERLLFTSATDPQDDEVNDSVFISVTVKILEKRATDSGGNIVGHNHFWNPEEGWRYLRIDGSNAAYATHDFDLIFAVV